MLSLLISCSSNSNSEEELSISELSKSELPDDSIVVLLPEELHEYEAQIVSSRKDFIGIELNKKRGVPQTTSKVGGYPYFPQNMEYPKAANGDPLDFLAQINFSEVPAFENYPTSGLLQFFIARDDLYGLDFDDQFSQKNYRVIYHENTDAPTIKSFPELDAIRTNDEYYSPNMTNAEFEMSFYRDASYVPCYDKEFEKYMGLETWPFFEQFGEKEDLIWESYSEFIYSSGNKIGGYAFFTQEDPRIYHKDIEDWVLLFQLDSDYEDIMWGDSGVGGFFISKEDLKNRDFSKVFYNWDCY